MPFGVAMSRLVAPDLTFFWCFAHVLSHRPMLSPLACITILLTIALA